MTSNVKGACSAPSGPGICHADARQPCTGENLEVATFPQTSRTNRILFNSYLRQTGSDVNKVKCKQFTMFFVLYQFQHVPVVPGIWYIVPVVLLHKFCENDIFLEIKIHFLKTQVFLSQLRHDTNFCDIELYTCEGLQKDSPILAHRQVSLLLDIYTAVIVQNTL